jgi:hypothetical protein
MPVLGINVNSAKNDMKCCGCKDKSASWVRHTQFAGNHPFCNDCAPNEKDFKEDDSYKFWENIK